MERHFSILFSNVQKKNHLKKCLYSIVRNNLFLGCQTSPGYIDVSDMIIWIYYVSQQSVAWKLRFAWKSILSLTANQGVQALVQKSSSIVPITSFKFIS